MRVALSLLAAVGLLATGCLSASPVKTAAIPVPSPHVPPGVVVLVGNGTLDALPNGSVAPVFATFSTATNGTEPNVGITKSGAIFVTARDLILRSKDGGASWQKVFDFGPPPGTPNAGNPAGLPCFPSTADPIRDFDPLLWVDPETNRVFAPLMFPCLTSAEDIWSDDEGATWTDKPLSGALPVNDHQKIATGHYVSGGPLKPTPLYPNAIYYCYNKLGLQIHCGVSVDGGADYVLDQTVADSITGGCGTLNGNPATAPDGTVYVPISAYCDAPHVAVSSDNGVSWTLAKGPDKVGASKEDADTDLTVTPDGTLYMFYAGKDETMYLATSHDKGATWKGPFRVSPPNVATSVFPVVTSGDDGRVFMGFLGTTAGPGNPNTVDATARWNLYMAYTLDGESASPAFVVTQVTPDADPVQIGCIWLGGGANDCRNMGDFTDLSHDKDGRVYLSFIDGCTAKCANDANATDKQSRSHVVTVAILEGGPSVFVTKGLLSPLPRASRGNSTSTQDGPEEGPSALDHRIV